ncbi:MAG: Maf family protein [Lachnospiraceae bacterium]|nr:Maf family protein [Lachnospiraceae bacterium]
MGKKTIITREHPLILASASPRRAELLECADIPFVVRSADVEEVSSADDPAEYAEEISRIKAEAVAERIYCDEGEETVVLGADTVVAVQDKILGKPKDENEAFEMLKKIQGGTHKVITGVTICVCAPDGVKSRSFYETTAVSVYPVSDEQIKKYVVTGEPMDKAGAYAIQGLFSRYIRHIRGDYSNVVGLPIGRVFKELKNLGLENLNTYE